VILGSKELEAGACVVKDLAKGVQKAVTWSELAGTVAEYGLH